MDPLTIALLAGGGSSILSALGGYSDAQAQQQAVNDALNALASGYGQGNQMIDQYSSQRAGAVSGMYDPLTAGFSDLNQQYLNQLTGANMEQYNVQAPKDDFQFDVAAETQNLLNPELAAILDAQTSQLEGSAANAGKLFSGATGRAIADSTAGTVAQEYGRAQGQAMNLRGQKYGQWSDKFDQQLAAAQQNKSNALSNLQNMGAAWQSQGGLAQEQRGQQLGTMDAAAQGKLGLLGDYTSNVANIQANNSGGSATGSILGGLTGGFNTFANLYGALQ